MTELRFELVLTPADDGQYEAQLLQDDEVVAASYMPDEAPQAVAQLARSSVLMRLRPPSAHRGPHVTVLVRLDEGWPIGNLYLDGCKHDITRSQWDVFSKGEAVRCAKCEALLVPILQVNERD